MASNMVGSAHDDPPTAELVTGAVGNHCANCHAPLASDQRYCVNCGERRGKPSFPLVSAAPAASETAVREQLPTRRSARAAGATLVAGVATLLIAMGVGVLIGHDSSSPAPRASTPVQVVTVGSGGSAAASHAGASHSKSAKGKSNKSKTVVVHLTPKVTKSAATAASKVFGSSGNLSKNVTQKVGGSCNGGAGCQNHKFTGNFFNP
jgi:hypothetical protein